MRKRTSGQPSGISWARIGQRNDVRKEEKPVEGYTLRDLEEWDQKIHDLVQEMGLDCYPQEFEICDYYQMLGYLAYNGMPAHYPHWSFGKAFEKQKTLYDYGMSGLPYEMVINSSPALAYLMRDNSLSLQILTIAHVYGHNDFFKNNRTFRFSYPGYTLEMFKAHADRIRTYIEDPSIGLERVERTMDAAHALSLQCQRHLEVKKLSTQEQRQRLQERTWKRSKEFPQFNEPDEDLDLNKVPLEPEEDILFFMRDYNPYLADWQRDILTIVAEETHYFIPQMETKIMNEGWATYCHYQILNALDLPQGLYMEFLVHHNQVIRPVPGGLNPYYLGFRTFQEIEKRWGAEGKKRIFQARESDRDVSFLRQYLTEELMRELGLFAHEKRGTDRVITHISDEENWKVVKDVLLKNVGLVALPVIKILDANYRGQQALYLWHEYDGRELELSYAQQTLRYLFDLWQRRVILESRLEGKPVFLSYDGRNSVKITYQLLS
ncbi:MAG: SpoVR family protein [Candidatus Tectomicrobia bacterium]|uniref:SpoVR family protein n=1 Tax=Tectimicrobiota bacterium TaxID=2528274 RepID=A0A932FXK7_UNCTE|nr:SpoVR family protein [Candidatus Tectomicrobia bacterium]